jgi:hypothetical protein
MDLVLLFLQQDEVQSEHVEVGLWSGVYLAFENGFELSGFLVG